MKRPTKIKNRGETTLGERELGRNDSGGEQDSGRNDPDSYFYSLQIPFSTLI